MSPTSHAVSAYENLRQLLLEGAFSPGERLAEVALATRLGMSRTPVREALRRLQADGLVDGSWRGVAVPSFAQAELIHAYELRGALEALAAEGAARRVGLGQVAPAELDALRAEAGRARTATAGGDLGVAIERNRAFHEAIAAMAANPLTHGALARVWDRILVSTQASLAPARRRTEVAAEHDRLIAAIAAAEPDAAAAIARAHALATLSTLTAV